MEIIIEGCDGIGKTSVIERLRRKYSCDVLWMCNGDKTIRGFEEKAKLHNIISDRSFLSEWVYSKVFNRKTELTKIWMDWLLDYEYNKYKVFVLVADPNVIMERISKRGTDSEDYESIIKLNQAYKKLGEDYPNRINVIDTTNLTEEQVFEAIVNKITQIDES